MLPDIERNRLIDTFLPYENGQHYVMIDRWAWHVIRKRITQ